MKKIIKGLLMICILLMVTGCNTGVPERLRESSAEEAEQKVIAYLQESFGDEVYVELISTEQLSVPTAWFDGPIAYKAVKGAYEYHFSVTNQEVGFQTEVVFRDGYKLKENVREADIIEEYEKTLDAFRMFKKVDELVREVDPEAKTVRFGQVADFFVFLKEREASKLLELYWTLDGYSRKNRDLNYVRITLCILPENGAGRFMEKLQPEFMKQNSLICQGNEHELMEAFGLGKDEFFAGVYCEYDDPDGAAARFITSWASEEKFFRNLPEGTEEDLKKYYKNHDISEYDYIVLIGSMEPNSTMLDFQARGIYQ